MRRAAATGRRRRHCRRDLRRRHHRCQDSKLPKLAEFARPLWRQESGKQALQNVVFVYLIVELLRGPRLLSFYKEFIDVVAYMDLG
jgi:hypothetical protein